MGFKATIQKIPGYNTLVKPLHLFQAMVASFQNGRPAKNLRVIAVTGTNGKTTTCFLIWKMLNQSGHAAGLLTTVGWSKGGDDFTPQIEHMTTEKVGVLNQRIRQIKDAGAEFLVLETTSHAMSQYRTFGIPIEVAVFTNLTHDHLDYHKTMRNYRAAKGKLFKKARFGVINADDKNAEFFARKLRSVQKFYPSGDIIDLGNYSQNELIMYGIEHGDTRATEVELNSTGVEYLCSEYVGKDFMHEMNKISEKDWRKMPIKTHLPGEFNVYNSLAAVGVGRIIGLSDEEIKDGILALREVEGRMTRIDEGQDFTVIVDYAHAPDAIEKVLQDAKKSIPKNARIISVHGGAGQRDHSTREPRGEILGRLSDFVIITEDDSRDEDPAVIAEDFVKGAEKSGLVKDENLLVELNRREAIKRALELAKPHDMVLILGKGHEKTILRADGPHDFEDIKVAKELLKQKQ